MSPLSWSLLLGLAASAVAGEQTLLPGFESPSAEHRPKFRYWLPDANIDHGILADDIRALKEVGAGGLELVPFYNYGFGGPGMSEWDVYGFGKPAFKDVLVTALESCEANGLVMDFALGASQGQGVPIEPLTPGLAVQLVYGRTSVKGGEEFNGALPEPILEWNQVPGYMQAQEVFGNSRLVGVSAAAVKSRTQLESGDAQVSLDPESLEDLSALVVDSKLTWRAPPDREEYVLFALYERYTNQRSCVGIPTDVIANGSWVTDHFSAAGTELVTKFWEQNLLDPHVRGLIQSVGKHSWEDSMEIQASLFWTPDFIERFSAGRGYNPVKYLPLLFHQSTSFHGHASPYNTTYYLDGSENSGQSKYLQDYRLTLNEGYMEYVQALEAWAQSLGVSHSCQVAYNMPVDMLASVPLVSAPELESLGFPEIDTMLQFVGPAHLGGRNVISTEIGAVPSGGYSQTLPSLVKLFHDAFASGVNLMLIHGMPYGGEQTATTWPGYTPFQYMYTDFWGPKQPAWDHMEDIMHYTARNQLVLQSGTAKRDLAFYVYKDPWTAAVIQNGAGLREQGFTYEYLSPANLVAENATVSKKVLAPSGPAYRAIIVDHQTYISTEASAKLLEFAEQGLPIVFIGNPPDTTIGSSGQGVVTENMERLFSSAFPNVKIIQSSEVLVDALNALEVKPRVSLQYSEPTTAAQNLYTLWRSDGSTEYVFLYNTGAAATYHLTMQTSDDKLPHILNTWTGKQERLAVYSRSAAGIQLEVTLQQHQTAILAFAPGKSPYQITSHSSNVVKVSPSPDDSFSVLVNDPFSASLTLANGTVHDIRSLTENPGAILPEVEIGPWNLTVESWIPSTNSSSSKSAKELLHLGPQAVLRPWSEIPAVQNVSGVGSYTASFAMPRLCQLPSDQTATVIQLGAVLNTLRVWINGKQLPPVDLFDAQLDISDYLVQGQNLIRVETASTLFNAVKARIDWVKMYGSGPLVPELYTAVGWQAHGFVGPVRVKMLRKVSL